MIERLVNLRTQGDDALRSVRRALANDAGWSARVLRDLGELGCEAALIATCERCELCCVEPEVHGKSVRARSTTIMAQVSAWIPELADGAIERGDSAARRLLRIAGGLESRIVGESHVLGQVAAAEREALLSGTLGATLTPLFASARRTGRRVRSETEIGRLAGSYVQAAADALAASIEDRGTAVIAIIGGGALAADLFDALQSRFGAESSSAPRVTIFARHLERARERFAGRSIDLLPLAELTDHIAVCSAIVAATSSPTSIIDNRTLAAWAASSSTASRGRLLVDLGMPPNIDESVRLVPGTTLIRLSDLAGPAHAASELAKAHAIVDAELAALLRQDAARGRRHRLGTDSLDLGDEPARRAVA